MHSCMYQLIGLWEDEHTDQASKYDLSVSSITIDLSSLMAGNYFLMDAREASSRFNVFATPTILSHSQT